MLWSLAVCLVVHWCSSSGVVQNRSPTRGPSSSRKTVEYARTERHRRKLCANSDSQGRCSAGLIKDSTMGGFYNANARTF